MKNLSWKLLFLIISASLAFHASGQEHNVGYYQKISQAGGVATYQKVWSTYAPNIQNEPILPGDFIYLPPDGCDPNTGICNEVQGMPQAGPMGAQGDRIHVSCGSVCASRFWGWSLMLQGGGSGGGGWGQPEELILRPILEDDLPFTCIDQYDNEILNAIMSDVAVLAALQQLSLDSNFEALITLPPSTGGRIEAGGFLVPNGMGGYNFLRIGQDIGAVFGGTNACLFDFGLPEGRQWEPGTIFVHTHPWSAGDDQSIACGPGFQAYVVGPGEDDRQFLRNERIQIGIIMDKDALTVYGDIDPIDETSESRKCY